MLAICARGEKELRLVQKEAEQYGAEVIAITADVSKPKDVDRFISIVENQYGEIDFLINNASIFGPGPLYLADYPDEQFTEVLSLNVLSPFLMTKRVLPGMLARSFGVIIQLTSEAGKTGFAEWGAYGISKFAVEGMSETWADELEDTGVRINLLDPGEMNTEMHAVAVPDCDYPLAHPSEILPVFDYLLSDAAKTTNGKCFEAQTFLAETRDEK